jgi:multidrug efflux system outer membrane protein
MIGPDYERPQLPIPEKYREEIQAQDSLANLPWWKLFNDTVLQSLIKETLDNNRDLMVASTRIDAAQAQLGVTSADLLPRIDGTGSYRRVSISNEIFNSNAGPQDNFSAVAKLGYEIDVWGKLRRATRAREAELLSTEYGRRAVIVSLVSEVAVTYLALRSLDEQLDTARRTLKNREGATALIRARFEQGIVPLLDVNQAEIQESEAGVMCASLERQRVQTENKLSILLGKAPREVPRGIPLSGQAITEEIPTDIPGQLLERRPDLLATEAQIKAAVERIGVSKAEQLPSFSIMGFIGLQSRASDDLIAGNARTWGLGGDLLGPILDWGKRASQVDLAEAQAEAAKIQYEQAVLVAIREVEDASAAMRTFKSEHEHRMKQVRAASSAARLSRARYDDGMTSYIEVLDIERSLFEAELGAADTLQRYFVSIVRLYAALGGGWRTSESDAAHLVPTKENQQAHNDAGGNS